MNNLKGKMIIFSHGFRGFGLWSLDFVASGPLCVESVYHGGEHAVEKLSHFMVDRRHRETGRDKDGYTLQRHIPRDLTFSNQDPPPNNPFIMNSSVDKPIHEVSSFIIQSHPNGTASWRPSLIFWGEGWHFISKT